MSEVRLDTVAGCVEELTTCNREVAGFAHEWAKDAGILKAKEKRYDRLYKAALRGTTGPNADTRQATAHAAVEEVSPGLAEEIEELVGRVTEHRTLFEAIERRSSNVQSILKAKREENRLDGYVPREARQMASAA